MGVYHGTLAIAAANTISKIGCQSDASVIDSTTDIQQRVATVICHLVFHDPCLHLAEWWPFKSKSDFIGISVKLISMVETTCPDFCTIS